MRDQERDTVEKEREREPEQTEAKERNAWRGKKKTFPCFQIALFCVGMRTCIT